MIKFDSADKKEKLLLINARVRKKEDKEKTIKFIKTVKERRSA